MNSSVRKGRDRVTATQRPDAWVIHFYREGTKSAKNAKPIVSLVPFVPLVVPPPLPAFLRILAASCS